MLNRRYPSQLMARTQPWLFFVILPVIAFACISCDGAAQQTSSSREEIVQSPPTKGVVLPLTNAAPPQGNRTPAVPISMPYRAPIIATPTLISTPIPTPTLTPVPSISYEAESSQNTLSGNAGAVSCSGCSGGYRICCLGVQPNEPNGTLQFNNVNKSDAGSYTMTIYYAEGDSGSRTGYVSVNGGPAIAYTGFYTGSWDTVETYNMTISLSAGNNTIEFFNSQQWAPDIDRIVV